MKDPAAKPKAATKRLSGPRRAKRKREPIYVRVTDDGKFEPASAMYAGMCRQRKFRRGDLLRAEFTKPRYPKHHRLCMTLLNKVLDNQEGLQTMHQLLTVVKIKLGYAQAVIDSGTGKTYWVVESISFDSMDQAEFEPFWRDLCRLVRREYLPHLDEDQVAELGEMMEDE